VALSMAGGYGHDLATTVAVQVATLTLAAESWAGCRRAAHERIACMTTTAPSPTAARPTPASCPDHPLDGQRRLRPPEQRRLLQPVRHGGEQPADRAGALDIHGGDVIGLVVETHCNFFESLAFPQRIEAGVRVAQQGRSSVRYEIGLFAEGRRCVPRGVTSCTSMSTATPPPRGRAAAAYLQSWRP
jgi:hypothetical protein